MVGLFKMKNSKNSLLPSASKFGLSGVETEPGQTLARVKNPEERLKYFKSSVVDLQERYNDVMIVQVYELYKVKDQLHELNEEYSWKKDSGFKHAISDLSGISYDYVGDLIKIGRCLESMGKLKEAKYHKVSVLKAVAYQDPEYWPVLLQKVEDDVDGVWSPDRVRKYTLKQVEDFKSDTIDEDISDSVDSVNIDFSLSKSAKRCKKEGGDFMVFKMSQPGSVEEFEEFKKHYNSLGNKIKKWSKMFS